MKKLTVVDQNGYFILSYCRDKQPAVIFHEGADVEDRGDEVLVTIDLEVDYAEDGIKALPEA